MILLIDIGNTTINFATYENDKITNTYFISANLNKTSDQYYLDFMRLIKLDKVKEVVLASVVPYLTKELETMAISHLKIKPMILQPKIKTGVKIVADNPKEVGADLVAVSASLVNNKTSHLIIDLGTATKYIYLKKNAVFGVIITPGVEISIDALVGKTALLPNIDIIVPNKVLGSNTIECMQSGVTYGTAAQIDGLIERIKEEVNEDFKVITTGGLSKIIDSLIKHETTCRPNLVFEGLLKIHELNKE